MMPGLRAVFEEDKSASGLRSMNLPSLHFEDIGDVSCIETDFNNLEIENGLYPCYSASSVNSTAFNTSENGKLELEDTKDNPRMARRTPMNLTLEQQDCFYKVDDDGENTLHLSIINSDETFTLLLMNIVPEYDVLNISNHLGHTSLHLAVFTRQPKTLRRLICGGATVMIQDKKGDTPLHIACRLGDSELVKHLTTPVRFEETLVNRYSIPFQRIPQDFRIRNYNGQTCLHVAASSGHRDIIRMLLASGADINLIDDKSGRTILHLATDSGNTELVELLLSYREIKVSARDYAGLTPLQLAYGRKHTSIVKILSSLSEECCGSQLSHPMFSLGDETVFTCV